MTPLPDDQRVVVGRLGVDERLARLEYLPVERQQRRGERRNHLLERSADVLLGRLAVDHGKCVVHPDEAKVAVPEADAHRRRYEQRVELRVRLLRGTEQTRIVDGERRAPRDLVRELEIVLAEAATGLARAQRDRPEQPASRLERHDDVGHRVQRVIEREMLLVDGGVGKRTGPRVLEQERLTARQHLRHRMRRVRLRRVPAPQLAQQLLPLGIPVRDHHLPQARFVLADRVHDAVVGDPRDEQLPEVGERRLVVERGGKERARLGQEADARLGAPLVGDVMEDVDHEVHLARLVQERCRTEDGPALVAARKDAIAEHGLLRRALGEREPVRQFVDRHQRAVLADDLEPLEQLRPREVEQLVARLHAADPCGGVVREDEPAVGALSGDPVCDAPEDRCQLVGRQRGARRPHGADLSLASRIHETNNAFAVEKRTDGAPATPRSCGSPILRSTKSGRENDEQRSHEHRSDNRSQRRSRHPTTRFRRLPDSPRGDRVGRERRVGSRLPAHRHGRDVRQRARGRRGRPRLGARPSRRLHHQQAQQRLPPTGRRSQGIRADARRAWRPSTSTCS